MASKVKLVVGQCEWFVERRRAFYDAQVLVDELNSSLIEIFPEFEIISMKPIRDLGLKYRDHLNYKDMFKLVLRADNIIKLKRAVADVFCTNQILKNGFEIKELY